MKHIFFLVVLLACIVLFFMSPARTVRFNRVPMPILAAPAALPAKLVSVLKVKKPAAVVFVKKIAAVVPSAPILTEPIKKSIEDSPIDLRSVVVVKCSFKNKDTGAALTAYGSGVMIYREGYVITARHVVDMEYAYTVTEGKQGRRGYALDSCDIAVPPIGTKTPTPAEIRAFNQFTLITEFAYRAQLAFVLPEPSATGMSPAEHDFADSALLRITSAVQGDLPHSFTASPMKIMDVPAVGDEVLTFGFPSGAPAYGSNFYLQGSVGEIKDIVGGDQLFKNQPVGMTALLETIGGRSGSPVFWHGFVIGVISSKEDYSRNTTIAGIYPLARFAQEAGIAIFK